MNKPIFTDRCFPLSISEAEDILKKSLADKLQLSSYRYPAVKPNAGEVYVIYAGDGESNQSKCYICITCRPIS